MLRRQRQLQVQIHQLMDACIFAVSFWVAASLRESQRVIEFFHLPPPPPADTVFWFFLVLIPMAPLVLEWQGYYNLPFFCRRREKAWVLLKGCGLVTIGLVLVSYAFQLTFARSVVIWFGIISFFLVYVKEEVLRALSRNRFALEHYDRTVLLIGLPDELQRMAQDLKRMPMERVRVVAKLDISKSTVQELVAHLHEHSVNAVIVSGKHASFDKVEACLRACELEGVESWLVADFFRTEISKTSFDEFGDRPVLVFRSTPEASWQSLGKQLLDLIGAAVLLALLTPLLLVVALVIRLTSPGPVFFSQQRAGLNGRPFTMLKFRTMVTNAEQLKQELERLNEMSGPVFKVTKDPRVTPLGRFLRKYSIDELPQLLNVLIGDMSLVGPRPLPIDEVARFDDVAHRRRLSVKPGLTCLWQVSGRNNVTDFEEWVRLDLQYIDNWSLWLDLKILLRTVPAVFTGAGAK